MLFFVNYFGLSSEFLEGNGRCYLKTRSPFSVNVAITDRFNLFRSLVSYFTFWSLCSNLFSSILFSS